jgi:hypothetical protein
MSLGQSIVGTWTLNSFQIESPDKVRSDWGTGAKGLLIYAPTGHMSVSINKSVEYDNDQSPHENVFDSILFYSGTYRVEGEVIKHQVTQASNPTRIGKEMIRFAELKGDTLQLTSPVESFGRAILVWKKVSA